MKAVKLEDDLYRKAEKLSEACGIKVDDFMEQALKQGIKMASDRSVIDLYKAHNISLQRAAEMLSIDIWEMIEKIKKADIHLDYSMEELIEDLR